MRGRKLIVLLLALVLALPGCSWMDGSYVSVTPHQVDQGQSGEGNAQPVGSYMELRSALIRMVDEGSTEGLFSLAEYPGEDVKADAARAVEYVTKVYPIGNYAVKEIVCDFGTALGANAMTVDITYRYTRQELESIRTVRGMEDARKAITEALDECADKLVLQISGYQQVQFVDIVRDYSQRYPDRVMEMPSTTSRIFPDRGNVRVVELLFFYSTDRETLRSMREQVQPVFSSAALYVSGEAAERTKFSQLHAFLMERFDYKLRYSQTTAYSLLCEGMGDSRAFAQVYAAMCSRIGLEARAISGKLNGVNHWWNQVQIEGQWYHLDLLSSPQFQPMTDAELVGYEWDPE